MRFGFLARFAAVLLVGATAAAIGLSLVFARSHLEALRRDLIANTVGQASAQIQPALDMYARAGRMDAVTRERLNAAVGEIMNFQELVRGVRLYAPAGTALLPAGSPPQIELVTQAVRSQNIVQSAVFRSAGDHLLTVYVPLGASSAPGYVAVAAIDVSLDQLDEQTQGETRFVVVATVIAVGLLFISLLTLAIAAQRELDRRRREAETTFMQTMEGIANLVDQRDRYTAGHSRRVAAYSVLVAGQLGESPKDIDNVRWGALLHDLGKIGVPDAVLLKPGPLSAEERAIINGHPTLASEILGPVEAMEPIVPCVLHHHERWDGTGYPSGLAGTQIPKLARIIAVADTFDAMTTDRPYRMALTVEEARRRLIAGRAVQWEARCIDAIIRLIDSGAIVPPPREGQNPVFGRRLDPQIS